MSIVHFNPEAQVHQIDKSLYTVAAYDNHGADLESSSGSGSSTPPHPCNDNISILSGDSSRIIAAGYSRSESLVSNNSAYRMAANVARKFKRGGKNKDSKSGGGNSIVDVDAIGM